NAEVTLTGTVNTRDDKRLAEDIAESVSGVSNVENRLRVTQSSLDRPMLGTQTSTIGQTGSSGSMSATGSTGTTGSTSSTGTTGTTGSSGTTGRGRGAGT